MIEMRNSEKEISCLLMALATTVANGWRNPVPTRNPKKATPRWKIATPKMLSQ
jgi:hypothetical protein